MANRLLRKKRTGGITKASILLWIGVAVGIVFLLVTSTTSGKYLRATTHRSLSMITNQMAAVSSSSSTAAAAGATGEDILGKPHTEDPEEDLRILAELTKSPPPGTLNCPPGLVPIYDRILPPSKNHNSSSSNSSSSSNNNTTVLPPKKIPRILHLSYKNRCLPEQVFGAGVQRWKDELPTFSVYYHDDEAVDKLLNADWPEFPHLHRMMKCMHYKGAIRVDLWRMLVIYRFGGFYADIDNVPAKEFRGGDAIDPEDTFFASSDGWTRPNQNAFGMEPRHPIAIFTVQTILKNLYEMPSLRSPQVVFVTGPMAFRDGYISYLEITQPRKTQEEILKTGVHKGFLNKQIRKVGRWEWMNPVASEEVEYDGRNMTKKERDHAIAGSSHWSKVIYWNRKGDDISCREYLYQLDHPSPENRISANWTANEVYS